MTAGILEFVNEDDLAKVVVEVPGDGSRLLICILQTLQYEAGDSVIIVAMADDIKTLAERVRDAGLMVDRQPTDWKEKYPWQVAYGTDGCMETNTCLLVLDLPPAAVRFLNLAGDGYIQESIELMRARQVAGTHSTGSAIRP